MEEKRAFSKAQFHSLNLDTSDYKFNKIVGTFHAKLDIKKWGNNRNLLAFFTLVDGGKVISSAPYFKDYLGLGEIPLGSMVEITYAKSNIGKLYLATVKVINENDMSAL